MDPKTVRRTYLEVGDLVMDMGWLDLQGEPASLYQSANAGRIAVLFICPSPDTPAAEGILKKFAQLHSQFRDLNVLLAAVSGQPVAVNLAAAQRLDLSFPILSDVEFLSGRATGLEPAVPGPLANPLVNPHTQGLGTGAASPWCALIIDPGRRIVRRIEPWSTEDPALAALADCTQRAGQLTPVPGVPQAPVLIVPDVLNKDHCARLINHWESGQRYTGGVASDAHGRNVPIKNIKVREDVALPDDGPEAQEVFDLLRRRLFPEIRKAFSFQVTRGESLRLGCYHATDGGHFKAHRDDTTPYTAHRRFAMSLGLDGDAYEGGYVRFPEYGPQVFHIETGMAVVFSASMLHEVTKITKGRRLILLGFFYSEAEEALRQKINAERRAAESKSTA